jgi:hypothetical protein
MRQINMPAHRIGAGRKRTLEPDQHNPLGHWGGAKPGQFGAGKKRGRGVQGALMACWFRARPSRAAARAPWKTANGPDCHGGGHARPSGSLRGRGAMRALLERIDMRNLFSAYRDRAKPPRLPLSGRSLLAELTRREVRP